METSVNHTSTLLKALLACGIIAAALSRGGRYPRSVLSKGYSLVLQSISELSAGRRTRHEHSSFQRARVERAHDFYTAFWDSASG